MGEDKNYYEILELPLEPLVTSTADALAAISAKSKEWNKKINALGNKGIIFKRYRDLCPKMKEALGNAEVLKEQGKEALLRARRKKKEELSTAAGGKPEISKAQYDNVCRRAPVLSNAVMQGIVKEMGLAIVAGPAGPRSIPVPTKPAPPQGLKLPVQSKLNDLFAVLPALGKKSVYEVLGCTPATALRDIQECATKCAERVARMPDKSGSEASALSVVSKVASQLFADEASKKGYDYEWAKYLVEKEITGKIEVILVGQHIDYEPYMALIEDARKLGMSEAEAEWYVYYECCERRKAPLPALPAEAAPRPKKRQCPHCYALNELGTRSCVNCGNAFAITCPKCGKEADVSSLYCSCGFALCNMPLARTAFDDARKALAAKKFDEARSCAKEALHYWPGHEEAQRLLKEIEHAEAIRDQARLQGVLAKLKAPACGHAKVNAARHVEITWENALFDNKLLPVGQGIAMPDGSSQSIAFHLVRKEGAVPSSPQDGTCIVSSASNRYEDTSAVPGIVYGYAVFVGMGNMTIPAGCPCGKALVIPNPKGLSMIAGNGTLTLQWELDPKAVGAVIIRKTGGVPTSGTDGARIDLPKGINKYTDSKLTNGQMYGYLLGLVFKDETGRSKCSGFARISGAPATPPPAINKDQWTVQGFENEVRVSWQGHRAADIRWVLGDAPLAAEGSLLQANDPKLARASFFRSVNTAAGSAIYQERVNGVKYVTPVIYKGGTALVCACRKLSLLKGITGLSAHRDQRNIYLTFTWPHGCEKVIAAYSHERFPTSTEAPNKIACTRQSYEHYKAITIPNAGDKTYYFSVFACYYGEDGDAFSNGENIKSIGAAQRANICYTLVTRKKSFLFGKREWILQISSSVNMIPAMQLRGKRNAPPVNRNDGVQVLAIPEVRDVKYSVVLNDAQALPGYSYKMFLADVKESGSYNINHPSIKESTII